MIKYVFSSVEYLSKAFIIIDNIERFFFCFAYISWISEIYLRASSPKYYLQYIFWAKILFWTGHRHLLLFFSIHHQALSEYLFCSHQVFWPPYLTGPLKLERLVWGGDPITMPAGIGFSLQRDRGGSLTCMWVVQTTGDLWYFKTWSAGTVVEASHRTQESNPRPTGLEASTLTPKPNWLTITLSFHRHTMR